MIRTAIIALALAATIAPASADWRDRAFQGHAYRTGDDCRRCGRHHRRWRARRPVVRHDGKCKPAVAVTGDQGQNEAAAWAHAVTAWRGRVRWLYGERYADDQLAQDVTRACAPSSIPDAYRDKANPQLYRCELVARPCRQDLMRVMR